MTLGRWFDHLGCSPRLRSVLNWCHGVHGVAPSKLSLTMHAAAVIHYLAGAWYPEGGGQAIVDALTTVIRDNSGEIIVDTDVEQILVDDVERLYAACDRGEMRATSPFITAASLKDPTSPRLCRPGQTNLQVVHLAPAGHDFWGTGATYAPAQDRVPGRAA